MERFPYRFNVVHIPFVIVFILVLSACALFGQDDEGENTAVEGINVFGDQTTLVVGPAFLMCTQECSDRGFCGTRPDGSRVILMSTGEPTTQNFNVAVPDNSAVIVGDVSPQNAVLRVDQQTPLTVNFYSVTTSDNLQTWVAGYCVGQQQPLPQ